jgi:hypothetical protein
MHVVRLRGLHIYRAAELGYVLEWLAAIRIAILPV